MLSLYSEATLIYWKFPFQPLFPFLPYNRDGIQNAVILYDSYKKKNCTLPSSWIIYHFINSAHGKKERKTPRPRKVIRSFSCSVETSKAHRVEKIAANKRRIEKRVTNRACIAFKLYFRIDKSAVHINDPRQKQVGNAKNGNTVTFASILRFTLFSSKDNLNFHILSKDRGFAVGINLGNGL